MGRAPGRAPQRAEYSIPKEAQEGVKGGTLAGGPPSFLRLAYKNPGPNGAGVRRSGSISPGSGHTPCRP